MDRRAPEQAPGTVGQECQGEGTALPLRWRDFRTMRAASQAVSPSRSGLDDHGVPSGPGCVRNFHFRRRKNGFDGLVAC